jgi:hypothetical protein
MGSVPPLLSFLLMIAAGWVRTVLRSAGSGVLRRLLAVAGACRGMPTDPRARPPRDVERRAAFADRCAETRLADVGTGDETV